MAVTEWTGGRIVLGCGTFGGIGGAGHLIGRGLDVAASLETLDEAAALGIAMLDTAERYAGGASETIVGEWLAGRDTSVTASIRVTTKVAPSSDTPFDAAFIEPIVAGSLDRLGVDHVDWLLTHAPDDATPIEATLEALEEIRASQRCRHIGGCNLDVRQLEGAIAAADRLGVAGYELVQNGYSLMQPDDDAEVRRLCAEHRLAYVAFSPLAGGVLTGKYRRDERAPAGTRLDLRPDGYDELLTAAMFDAIDVLAGHASTLGVSTGALALAWLLHRDDVTALVTGPARSAPHLELAAQALGIELTDDIAGELTEVFRATAV